MKYILLTLCVLTLVACGKTGETTVIREIQTGPPTQNSRFLVCRNRLNGVVWQGWTHATPVRGFYSNGVSYYDVLQPNNTFTRVTARTCIFQ